MNRLSLIIFTVFFSASFTVVNGTFNFQGLLEAKAVFIINRKACSVVNKIDSNINNNEKKSCVIGSYKTT